MEKGNQNLDEDALIDDANASLRVEHTEVNPDVIVMDETTDPKPMEQEEKMRMRIICRVYSIFSM